jgi:hypothetical protein
MAKTMIPAQGWQLDEYDQNMNRVGSYSVIGFLYDDEREEVAVVYVENGEIDINYPDGLRLRLGQEER